MAEPVGHRRARFDVTSLGESLIRLSVGVGHRLASARSLDLHVAGAESNVCAALSGLGRRTAWLSRLPDNPLGHLILQRMRGWGIDTHGVVVSRRGRVGTYFVELASPPLPIRVTYDRAESAFTELDIDAVDWDHLLDTRVLHLTGITPALSPNCRNLIREAIHRAKERGVLVSFDVNFRARLWSPTDAAEVLRPLIREVDLLICGRKDAIRLFGLAESEDRLLDGLQELTRAEHLVVSLGKAGAIARSSGSSFRQDAISVDVVDRIGAGDAFAAGVLDGLLQGSLEEGLATGTSMAAIALCQHGDVVTASRNEVNELQEGIDQAILR